MFPCRTIMWMPKLCSTLISQFSTGLASYMMVEGIDLRAQDYFTTLMLLLMIKSCGPGTHDHHKEHYCAIFADAKHTPDGSAHRVYKTPVAYTHSVFPLCPPCHPVIVLLLLMWIEPIAHTHVTQRSGPMHSVRPTSAKK